MQQVKPKLVESIPSQARISVIIPAYNEASTKERRDAFNAHLSRWTQEKDKDSGLFVVVVNDGSKDETTKVIDHYGLPTLWHPGGINRGKGASLTLGLKETSGIRAFTDADGSYSPSFILDLTDRVENGSDLAIAVRPDGLDGHDSLVRKAGHIGLGFLLEKIAPTGGIRDVQGGAKALSDNTAKQLLPFLKIEGYAWDRQLLYEARKRDINVDGVKVPDGSFHSVGDSHIRFVSDGLAMISSAIKIRRN